MTTDFILPDIGEGIVECELLEWLVAEGDEVHEDQPVAEVMTDKATVQIPAVHAGIVEKLYYQPGDIAKVEAPLFALRESKDKHSEPDKPLSSEAEFITPPESAQPSASQNAEDFLLPDIGEGIAECEIVKWHVEEGDAIAEDQVVVEVMTDKAVVEIPAKHAATIGKRYYREGDVAKVHHPLFSLFIHEPESDSAVTAEKTTGKRDAKATKPSHSAPLGEGNYEPPVVIPGKVIASPAVRRIAREQEIDLGEVEGSGKKGRILKKDVISERQTYTPNDQPASISNSNENPAMATGYRDEKVRGVQAAMAKRMAESVRTIPHFTVSDELPVDRLLAAKNSLKESFAAQGVKLTLLPFFIKALSLSLNEYPILNSQLREDDTILRYFEDHNIGVAVDSPHGLMVPNIKRVQTLSLLDIAQKLQRLIEDARAGKLNKRDIEGGTISISNIGPIGGITATPVINKPEAAIVALGKIQCLPRFNHNDEVEAVNIMTVNWSADHRFIDGATMVRFNNTWSEYLKEPAKMLMKLA